MSSLKKEAQKYLDSRRVVKSTEVVEGLIVELDQTDDFRIVEITKKGNDVNSEVIATFDFPGIFSMDELQTVLNFKKKMLEIVGRRKYYLDEGVYNFLCNKDIDEDDLETEPDWDNAKERAYQEAAVEEAAEHALEVFLRSKKK